MVTILEYIWAHDEMTILRLVALGLLGGQVVEIVLGVRLQRTDAETIHKHYKQMMRHDAYRRGKGGAIRQVRWA
ncbi:MAG: hypothetical protein HPY71_01560 [Firmicutes bacterium]|nr:hypothetical protein [Bacillota bacterium]